MLVCELCGSKNIQRKAWVDANTTKFIELEEEYDEAEWCEDCNEYVGFVDETDYKPLFK